MIIQTDNEGELVNNNLKDFCETNGIKLIHGAPRHPQSQGEVEAFNYTFKKWLNIVILSYKAYFELNNLVNNVMNMYNNTIHSTTKISPIDVFTNKNKNIIQQIIKNTEKSQNKYNNSIGLQKN